MGSLNVKDEEKIANRDTFWDQISIHGLENMQVLKEELNDVGKGFCLAKWNQVSILLQTGQTHSCHHPRPHVVPLEELEVNPSALEEVKDLVVKTMESAVSLSVPLLVETGVGDNWMEAK